jgi:hypothetical protein
MVEQLLQLGVHLLTVSPPPEAGGTKSEARELAVARSVQTSGSGEGGTVMAAG